MQTLLLKKELLNARQLKQFTPAPMKVFTRNTEHYITTCNIFDLKEELNFIAADYDLPLVVGDYYVLEQSYSFQTALRILINSVKNN